MRKKERSVRFKIQNLRYTRRSVHFTGRPEDTTPTHLQTKSAFWNIRFGAFDFL